jgi:hypothetical protein
LIYGRPIPDWKKFLGVSANKQALLKFLGDFVIRSHSQSLIVTSSDDELYLAGLFSDPSTAKNFTPSKVSDCPDLFSNHEEADARFGDMNVKGRIIIKSPDTDVLLLCIHFFPSMRNTKELGELQEQMMVVAIFQSMIFAISRVLLYASYCL